MECLIDWVDDNQEALRGSKSVWVKDCKEQIFKDDPELTTDRIGVKFSNLKASWSAAKKRIADAGWEAASDMGGELERRCPFFQRLDVIFGTRMNASLGASQDILDLDAIATQRPENSKAQYLLVGEDPEIPHQSDDSEGELENQSEGRVYEGDDGGVGVLVGGDSDEESYRETPPPPRSKRRRSSPAAPKGRGLGRASAKGKGKMGSGECIMGDRQSYELGRELKRVKLELEMQRERLEAKERLARVSASTTIEVAKIQAEAQVRQFELLTQIFGLRVGPNTGTHLGGSATGSPGVHAVENVD